MAKDITTDAKEATIRANDVEKTLGKELIRSAKGVQRDMYTAILKPEQAYTKDELERLINEFKGKKVK